MNNAVLGENVGQCNGSKHAAQCVRESNRATGNVDYELLAVEGGGALAVSQL